MIPLQKLILGLVLAAFSLHCNAQYPSNLHNSDLRVWLKSNMYDGEHSDLGYNSARQQMYSFTDEVNGKIYCIYTDFEMDAEFTTFPDPINAEHIIPQSFYGSTSPMKSDIHNLRPSHENANSARSFFDFGEVNDSQAFWYGVNTSGNYTVQNSEPTLSDDYSEGVEFLWEPQEDRKGDVARQVFYFYTMYPTQAGPITDLVDVNLMYQWHLNDPADDLEIQRNDRIETAQGNRNPYIDFPNLVYDAWLWVEILGCTDSAALNYDSDANTDDDSCIYIVLGCTDQAANNFNSEATLDDGSCTYDTTGCTDPNYLEFNPEALSDDGSCVTLKIYGCRYSNAANYDSAANTDDGSCFFEDDCFGDFNGDYMITVIDLTGFLAAYGNCE